MILPALALAAFASTAAWAQSPTKDQNDDGGQTLMQKIRDELAAEGYKDVTVVPSAFIVSGRDKEGKPVMMLIGPNSMTMLTPLAPDDGQQPPQQAQQKDKTLQKWE